MAQPRPNSRFQILTSVTDRHVIPVEDLDRPDLRHLVVQAGATGVAVGDGAPVNYSAAVAATYTHNSVAANADLTFTALAAGVAGNAYSVEVIQPVTLSAVLEVLWDGAKVTINLPTDGAGAPVAASALEVKTAFDLTLAASYISCAAEGDGSGTVDVLAEASLANGAEEVLGSGQAWLYVDNTTPALYVNTGTLEAASWTAV